LTIQHGENNFMPQLTLSHLQNMKYNREKITVLALYDASFAQVASKAGVDILFVGDSLGMVIKGKQNTLSVELSDIIYHIQCVVAGNHHSVIMADLPFMSYYTPEIAMNNAKQLIQAGAEIIKIEGGKWLCDTISLLTERGIPVCSHLGLTPQFIHILGGYKVQGRDEKRAQELLEDAVALQAAGAQLLVLECIPHVLAQEITQTLRIPVIGIGAGAACDGQVLVIYDIIGLTSGRLKFVANFIEGQTQGIQGAIKAYVSAVKEGTFPTLEHSFE
jgi:3-methyl-2-oxobutanoate hydroxymethyltransferase